MAADLQPDVVLMDLSMPGMGGVEATRRLLAAHPGLQIVVLTSFSDGVTDRTQAALWAERNGLRRGPS